MRLIYSAILYLLLPFIVLRLLLRSFRNPACRLRWQERFGYLWRLEHKSPLIWIHAVSVGEVRAAKPLVDVLRREHAGYQIMLTTMTPTGADTVAQLFADAVIHHYVPYDFPGAVMRFIKITKPCCLIVMETELWPNLFHYCRLGNIPVILANGRMSGQSAGRYRLASRLTRQTLNNISLIAAQSGKDAERFIALGAVADKVSVTGNLKYDFALPDDFTIRHAMLRREWPDDRPIWIAASTHDGEEEIILRAHAQILHACPESLLIIAPRHPERFSNVATLCNKSGFKTVQKTTNISPDKTVRIYVLDTIGELIYYYALARIAFVGGSLVNVGGHNMLEPVSLGIPVISGPYLYNFHEIGKMLQETGVARVIHNEHELAEEVIRLFADEKLRHDAGQNGQRMVQENRGSSVRFMRLARPIIDKCATKLGE